MATHNPRINVTLDHPMIGILSSLAKHEHKSLSSLTKELVLEALERREDMALSTIAKMREIKNAKLVKHEDAWK